MPPARKIAESISARSISEVSVLLLQRNRFPPPRLEAFKISMARLSPVSVMRNARPIISTSLLDFASRSSQKRPSVARTDFVPGTLFRVAQREICGDNRRFHAAFREKVRENLFVRWRGLRVSLHFALQLAEHDEFVRIRLLAAAIDFQIAQYESSLAIALKKNEWI